MAIKSVCVAHCSTATRQEVDTLEPEEQDGTPSNRRLKNLFLIFNYKNEMKRGIRLLYLARKEDDNLTEKVIQDFLTSKLETRALYNKIYKIAQTLRTNFLDVPEEQLALNKMLVHQSSRWEDWCSQELYYQLRRKYMRITEMRTTYKLMNQMLWRITSQQQSKQSMLQITKFTIKKINQMLKSGTPCQVGKVKRILAFCLTLKNHLKYADSFNSRKMTEEALKMIRRVGLPQHIKMEVIPEPVETEDVTS